MLSKFSGDGDAYVFLSEFEEVCSMMQFPNVPQYIVKFRFIPFTLKESAKKWMHSHPENSISRWDVLRVFLRKIFLKGKTMKLRNEINHVGQLEIESFRKCFKIFELLLGHCPHHGLECWHSCRIIYKGPD